MGGSLPINLSKNDIQRADDGNDIGNQVPNAHLPQRLQINK